MSLTEREQERRVKTIVNPGRDQVECETRQLDHEEHFFKTVGVIVEKECPEMRETYSELSNLLTVSRECQRAYVKVVEHSVEDINDIKERWAIVWKFYKKYKDAKESLESARVKHRKAQQKLSQDRSLGGKNEVSLTVAVRKEQENLKSKIRATQDAIRNFVEEKRKFNTFEFRRTHDAFLHLGLGIANVMKQSCEIWQAVGDANEKATEFFKDKIRGNSTQNVNFGVLPSVTPYDRYETPVQAPQRAKEVEQAEPVDDEDEPAQDHVEDDYQEQKETEHEEDVDGNPVTGWQEEDQGEETGDKYSPFESPF